MISHRQTVDWLNACKEAIGDNRQGQLRNLLPVKLEKADVEGVTLWWASLFRYAVSSGRNYNNATRAELVGLLSEMYPSWDEDGLPLVFSHANATEVASQFLIGHNNEMDSVEREELLRTFVAYCGCSGGHWHRLDHVGGDITPTMWAWTAKSSSQWNDVWPNLTIEVADERKLIQIGFLPYTRWRIAELSIGLQSLELPAFVLCEIVSRVHPLFGRMHELAYHKLWDVVVAVKHFVAHKN